MSRVLSRLLVGVLSASFIITGYATTSPTPARAAGSGSVSLTALGTAYSQEFDALATTGTANQTLPTGWFLNESGTSGANNDAYAAGTGSGTAGDVYSFGASGSSERAFGTLFSGSLTPTIGASFTNDTGSTISSLDIGYDGEQWRLGALGSAGTPPRGADRLDFQYSLTATSLTTGTWTDVDSLDFTSPVTGPAVGALDGNSTTNRTEVLGSVQDVGIAPGATFWLRWTDFNVASSDDGLAVDEFSITPRVVIGPPTLSVNDVSQAEGDSGTTAFDFTVSLSSPAGAGGVTFDVATADGTATVADNDYVANSLTGQTIPEGGSSYTFGVTVNGDTVEEGDETFFVNVTNVVGATIADGQGVGTIGGDDVDFCAQPFTAIYEIQGSGTSAAITGTVTTQGVVVGDFEGSASNSGFFIQDATGDENAATSDGIFVFTGANASAVDAGDVVRVTGFARERFTQTTINGSNSNGAPVTEIVHCGTGSVQPTDVELPFDSATAPERYEGMLVRFPQPLVIAEYFNYDRFGEIVLALPLDGESRPFTGTAIDEPGDAANARTLANSLRRITLDDNQSAQNPSVLRHPNGEPFSLANRFRGGDTVANATGVLGFDFSLYRIFPTGPADYTAENPRPQEAPELSGTLRVAAMNTLNFFLTADVDNPNNGPGDNVCGGNGTLECRGWDASQTGEFDRQRDKLLVALAGLDADVLGLNEIENTPDVDPLGDPERGVVAGLNDILGAGTYDSITTGVIGTDAIRVGLIYKPGVVEPVGDFEVLDSTDDPRFIDTKSRPALAQTFEEIATGARFTVVVNHLKSKGSDCNDVGDPDAADGQGNCSGTRELAAQALVDWIASDPTGSGDPDFLIMGDLNSYAMEDPIDAIKAGSDDIAGTDDDWTNLIAEYQGTYAYSYVFDGQAGYLDHALANATIVDQVTGAAEWHINADEPDILDYDTSFKPPAQDALYEPNQFRTSDHDPVVVGLSLVNDAPTIEVTAGLSCTPSGIGGSFRLVVDDTEVAPGDLVVTLADNTNTSLVPNGNVVFSGTGATRTVLISAASHQSGSAVLTIAVDDGWNTTTETITVEVGTEAAETLGGSAGADLIAGVGGDDSISGGGGADVLCGGNGDDSLAGGDGNDALDGGRGADQLGGGAGDDSLVGGQGADTLTGDRGADAFSGGPGADLNVDLLPTEGDTSDGT